jgi:acetyl esterase/lipase
MTKIFVAFLALWIGSPGLSSAFAADPLPAIPLWPNGAPGEAGDLGPEGTLPPRPNDTTIRIENVSQPTITVYPPPKGKNCGTAVVICPGGAYNILAWNKEGTEAAEWLNTLGVTGIVLKYRVPVRKHRERHAAPLEDVQRAMGLVRQRANDWGVDPKRVGLLGFSAGGHLAAVASTNFERRSYDVIDDSDRQSCRPDFTLLIYPGYLVDQENRLAPELKITADTPRTFIAMTEDDGIRVECGLFYYLALKEAKVPAEMHLYPSGGHGYGLRPSSHLVSTWPARAGDWLKANGLLGE